MKDDRVYLLHILDAIQRILAYTAEGEEVFFSDTKTQDAVVRNLEIMGEATKNLSAELKEAHPAVLWKQVSGMRDKLIHDYFGANMRLVFEVVKQNLPSLKRSIERILDEL
ncbi:MAG: DUF86 domain-containing protein [Desulfomonile tiedjei]|nr:DUF86 domain-containing protein [Desulfomonile tiedjei]